MESFILEKQVGKADLDQFFPNFDGIVKLDDSVRAFLRLGLYPEFEIAKSFPVKVIRHENGGSFKNLLQGWAIMPSRDDVCAVLSYLGTPEGFKLLGIPEGKEEVNILLGFFTYGTKTLVLHIEHEKENGKFPEITIRGALGSHKEVDLVINLLLHYK